jgi:hypothetical protein
MGNDPEKMDLQATQQYFKDIGVNLEDISCFLAFAVIECQSIGEIAREGFISGWSQYRYDMVGSKESKR